MQRAINRNEYFRWIPAIGLVLNLNLWFLWKAVFGQTIAFGITGVSLLAIGLNTLFTFEKHEPLLHWERKGLRFGTWATIGFGAVNLIAFLWFYFIPNL